MRERVSYDDYYDKEKDYAYENRKGGSMFKTCVVVIGVGVAGYVIGYRKARMTGKTILDNVLDKFPDHKTAFKKVWNNAVDEYFEGK